MRSDFRAMGTTVRVVTAWATDPRVRSSAVAAIRDVFETEERRFSRFRDDSELSRLNASDGRPVRVSLTFAAVLRRALAAAAATDGAFDPTILGALQAAGYDRDFDDVLAGARDRLRPVRPGGRWRQVSIRRDVVRLPRGVGIDLGGLVKGWAADVAAMRALEVGLPWVLVNAGGDLRLAGRAPSLDVAIEDPDAHDGELGRLRIRDGGIATSSARSRAWGDGLHHLIDPRTGAPASTDLVQVTATAATCAEAEILAKTVLLRGSAAARDAAVAVTTDGRVLVHAPSEEAA